MSKNKYTFLNPGENILMEGKANMKQFMGINKGGDLILTTERLVFVAGAFNFGSKFDQILLSDVAVTGGTFNIFCPTPNTIKVVTKNGTEYQFVVTGKQKNEWQEMIAQTAQKYSV